MVSIDLLAYYVSRVCDRHPCAWVYVHGHEQRDSGRSARDSSHARAQAGDARRAQLGDGKVEENRW